MHGKENAFAFLYSVALFIPRPVRPHVALSLTRGMSFCAHCYATATTDAASCGTCHGERSYCSAACRASDWSLGHKLSLHVRPRASVLYVRATRTSLLRAVRTRGAGQLAPGPHALYVRGTCTPRTSLGRAVRTAYSGTTAARTASRTTRLVLVVLRRT